MRKVVSRCDGALFNKKLEDYRNQSRKLAQNSNVDIERPYFNMRKVYAKMTTKQSQLMKAYSACYIKLLK